MLDVEHAIGFTDTGRTIRVTPIDDAYCKAELTDDSDPARLRELLATALVPADLAALADDPLGYAGFWRELDEWDGRRFPLTPRSVYACFHHRPTYAPQATT